MLCATKFARIGTPPSASPAFPAIIPNSDTPMNTISRLEEEEGSMRPCSKHNSFEGGRKDGGNHVEEKEGDRLD